MELQNKNAWYGLVYNLLYPAILGSMLYDLFAFSGFSLWRFLSQLFLVLIYLVDYSYLYNDLMLPVAAARSSEIVADATVAILYRIAFACVALGKLLAASGLLLIVFLIYLFYVVGRHPKTRNFILLTAALLLVHLASPLFLSNYSPRFFVLILATVFSLYAYFVFYYGPKHVFGRTRDS